MADYKYDNPDDAYQEAQRRINTKAGYRSTTHFDLSGLGLTAVPSEVWQLTRLTILELRNNKLTAIPPEISQLTALRELDLQENQLTAVPPEIGQLTVLGQLYLNNNQLKTIPPEIGQLTALMRLHLDNNQLKTLPSEIKQLTELVDLYLYDNELTTIPLELTQLTQLEDLWLFNNPDLPIPPEIIAQTDNAQAILDYIRENQEAPSFPLNEAKLILVGQGGVGKTSLVKRLVHNEFDEAEEQTKGINIEKWSLPVSRRSQGTVPISLNIWDFGGQEIMHATHQFFLTKRSLYLLVLDARAGEEEGRVEYWLALINSFAPAAPVLIIINKSDQHHLDINRRGLQEKYPAIAGFVSTSASKDSGIDKLKTAIAAVIAAMPDVDSLFPASWMRVKEALVTMQSDRHYLPYADYKTLCIENGVKEESSQTTLINFLHDLGIVLNFNDDDRVRDTSVLNPNWVTGGIYTLLNNPDLQKKHGLLRRDQLKQILPADNYPAQKHSFLLEMMLKFELAFELPDRQTLLVPDLISKEQPAFDWDDENALQFAYQYSVLPLNILHRFMVRQNHLLDPKIRWRTGAMLHHNGFTALVKADIKAANIRISIIGDGNGDGDRRTFLYLLRNTFASIHASISGTKPQEVVPIPAHPDAKPISYVHLLNLERLKQPDKQLFEGMTELLSVQQLLDGVSTPTTRRTTSGNTYNIKGDLIIGDKAGGDIVRGDKNAVENITDSSVEIGRRG